MTNFEQEKATDVNSQVHCLTTKVNSMQSTNEKVKKLDNRVTQLYTELTEGIGQIKELLSGAFEPKITPIDQETMSSPPPINPWFDPEKLEKLRQPAALVISKDGGENVPLPALENIVTKNCIQINNTFTNKNGDTVVTTSSQDDRAKLVKVINDQFPNSSVKQPKVKMPTISIAGIRSMVEPEEFNNQILQLHPDINSLVNAGETFSVLAVRKQKKSPNDIDLYQASVRVSSPIRKLLENRGDYISIGLYRCKIYDHFYIKRCNKCQQFGHYKGQCKAPNPICGHCSKNHESVHCTEKQDSQSFQPTCVNCQKSTNSQQHTHSALDRTCPSYQLEQDKLKKSISYYNQKN